MSVLAPMASLSQRFARTCPIRDREQCHTEARAAPIYQYETCKYECTKHERKVKDALSVEGGLSGS